MVFDLKHVTKSGAKKSFGWTKKTFANYVFWGLLLIAAMLIPFIVLLSNPDRYYSAIIYDVPFLLDFFHETNVYYIALVFYIGVIWGLPVLIWTYTSKYKPHLAIISCAIISTIICIAFMKSIGLAKELALTFRSWLYIPLALVFFVKGIVLMVYRIWADRNKKEGK